MNQSLEKMIQEHLLSFFKCIEDTFSLDINNIKREWAVFNAEPVFFCVYIFTRLPKKGETCGKKIKSGEYCRIHNVKKDSKKEKEKVEKTTEKLEIVRMNYKTGKYIHQPTKLAFFSKEHKVVYGKLSLQDTLIPLCDKDIIVCKQYMFRYDLSLFKQCL